MQLKSVVNWLKSFHVKSKHRCNFLTRTNLMKFLARYKQVPYYIELIEERYLSLYKLVVRRAPPKGLPIWASICIHQIQHKVVIILTSLPINMKKLNRVQSEGLLKYHHLGQEFMVCQSNAVIFFQWSCQRSQYLGHVYKSKLNFTSFKG